MQAILRVMNRRGTWEYIRGENESLTHYLSRVNAGYHERKRPKTVTRGLPYLIGEGRQYRRLKRLVREYQHESWHVGGLSQRMIDYQCEKLHNKLYKNGGYCYYGTIPSDLDAAIRGY